MTGDEYMMEAMDALEYRVKALLESEARQYVVTFELLGKRIELLKQVNAFDIDPTAVSILSNVLEHMRKQSSVVQARKSKTWSVRFKHFQEAEPSLAAKALFYAAQAEVSRKEAREFLARN